MTDGKDIFVVQKTKAEKLNELTTCNFCGKILKKKQKGGHSFLCKDNPKYEENKKKHLAGGWTKGHKHTESTKKLLSIRRKEYLKKNKKEHNWSKFKNQESEPERIFREIIQNNFDIEVFQYYMPKESKRFFEIDFAIPSIKIGFEINGNQHYDKEGNLTEYYRKRKDYLSSIGWKTIDIHYLLCFHKEEIIEIIKRSINLENVDLSNRAREIINYRNLKKKNSLEKIKEAIISKERIIEEIKFFIEKNGVRRSLIKDLSKIHNISNAKITRILEENNIECGSILQKDSRNSQYGKCWIYSLEEKRSIRIPKEELEDWISKGWIKGRKMKFD